MCKTHGFFVARKLQKGLNLQINSDSCGFQHIIWLNEKNPVYLRCGLVYSDRATY